MPINGAKTTKAKIIFTFIFFTVLISGVGFYHVFSSSASTTVDCETITADQMTAVMKACSTPRHLNEVGGCSSAIADLCIHFASQSAPCSTTLVSCIAMFSSMDMPGVCKKADILDGSLWLLSCMGNYDDEADTYRDCHDFTGNYLFCPGSTSGCECDNPFAIFMVKEFRDWYDEFKDRDAAVDCFLNVGESCTNDSFLCFHKIGRLATMGCLDYGCSLPSPITIVYPPQQTANGDDLYSTVINGTEVKGTSDFLQKLGRMFDNMSMSNDCHPLPNNCSVTSSYRNDSEPASAHRAGEAVDICCTGTAGSDTQCNNPTISDVIGRIRGGNTGLNVIRECTGNEQTCNGTTGCPGGLIHIDSQFNDDPGSTRPNEPGNPCLFQDLVPNPNPPPACTGWGNCGSITN